MRIQVNLIVIPQNTVVPNHLNSSDPLTNTSVPNQFFRTFAQVEILEDIGQGEMGWILSRAVQKKYWPTSLTLGQASWWVQPN